MTKKIKELSTFDQQWPPQLTGALDVVDHLSVGYVPATKFPNDELEHVTGDPYANTSKGYNYPDVKEKQKGKCGQCKFYVEGGSCTLVKGQIDPINGTCKFWIGGRSLDVGTPVFPVYEKIEANYWEEPYEPHLTEFTPLSKTAQHAAEKFPTIMSQGLDVLEAVAIPSSLSITKIGGKKIEETWDETQHARNDAAVFRKVDGSQGWPKVDGLQPQDDQQNRNYVATGAKINVPPFMTKEEGHLGTDTKITPEFERQQSVQFQPPMHEETPIQEVEDDEAKTKRKKDWLRTLALWLPLISAAPLASILAGPTLELRARYTYIGHESPEICQGFDGKIYDLLNKSNRPVPPSEGLGYTNTHPNCKCFWEVVVDLDKPKKINKTQKKHIQSVHRHIGQAAKNHTLHTVKKDGDLSSRTRGSNPMKEMILIRETVAELAKTFKWVDDEYRARIATIAPKVGGKFYLIRASAETITDHRASDGEPHRRLLAGDELHSLTRTGIGKGTDINHLGVDYQTEGVVLDAEYDPVLKESQMVVHENDPEVIAAIDSGIIGEVSINAGTPRKMDIECQPDECFVVPRGLVLGETDGIAFTWVISDPRGMMWRGQHLPKARAGVTTTKIEPL